MTLEDFWNSIVEAYGQDAKEQIIAEEFVKKINRKLIMRDPKAIESYLSSFTKRNSTCERCENWYKYKTHDEYLNKKMDFPAWIGVLDESKTTKKSIMIIGESVSSRIDKPLSIAYELGRFNKLNDNKIELGETQYLIDHDFLNKKQTLDVFWNYIDYIFSNNLEEILSNLYITDLSKCFSQKNSNDDHLLIWDTCTEFCLINEIEYIKPRIVLFQGNTPYLYTRKILKKKGYNFRETKNKNNVKSGTFNLGIDTPTEYLLIWHSSYLHRRINAKTEFLTILDIYKDIIAKAMNYM